MAPLISDTRNSALTDKPGAVHAKPPKTHRARERRRDEYEMEMSDREDSSDDFYSGTEMSDREEVPNVADGADLRRCLTCRIKKIKCDETKPNCMRCTHGSRKCSWPEGIPAHMPISHAGSMSVGMPAPVHQGSQSQFERTQQQQANNNSSSSESSSLASSAARHRHRIENEILGSPSASFSPHTSPTSTRNTTPDPIPAPVLPPVRRGYWNRRGDHLIPDGHIVYAPLALAYPMELTEYPLEEDGYQNEEGAFIQYAERAELSASLPLKGRAPERPYETFVVYVNDNSRGSTESSPCDIKKVDEAGSPSKDLPRVSDPWDLDTRLAVFNSRRPKSPTSSSSSYGSAHSTHSRASSFSGSAGGHIPGTNRDDLEFPFAYPYMNSFAYYKPDVYEPQG